VSPEEEEGSVQNKKIRRNINPTRVVIIRKNNIKYFRMNWKKDWIL
jgi:hypothetical protein